jgi:hypothetical protein
MDGMTQQVWFGKHRRALPWLAAGVCAAAAAGFGAALEGYSHALHPLALLGARGVPNAAAFNLLGFVAPGLLLAWSALGLRARLPRASGWPPRIGATLALCSALAFAAQGLLPFDPEHPDAGMSRFHASAWTLWWLAFAPGAALLASARKVASRAAGVTIAVLLPVFVLLAPAWLAPALAQRIAFALWFGWWIAIARR